MPGVRLQYLGLQQSQRDRGRPPLALRTEARELPIVETDRQIVSMRPHGGPAARAVDLPSFEVGMTVTPCPSNPLGIKGCGEAGAIAAPPAVINAITDALGHEDVVMPATPQEVWRAVQKTRMPMAAE